MIERTKRLLPTILVSNTWPFGYPGDRRQPAVALDG